VQTPTASPAGDIWTIVDPVPWLFDLALKLLTRKSPAVKVPTVRATMAIP